MTKLNSLSLIPTTVTDATSELKLTVEILISRLAFGVNVLFLNVANQNKMVQGFQNKQIVFKFTSFLVAWPEEPAQSGRPINL